MAFNTKSIVKDKDGQPISQYYNPTSDSYEPLQGISGANKVVIVDSDGSFTDPLSLESILDNLKQLTGTVIDEETRKQNESQRIKDENIRITNEDGRVGAENKRVTAEKSRVSAESKRVTAETGRVNAEKLRVSLYDDMVSKLESGYFDGKNLEFEWKGTELGVRVEGETVFTYTNLVGPKGAKGDKGDMGPRGEQGIKGDKGDKGDTGSIDNLTKTHVVNALGYTPVKSVNNKTVDANGNVNIDIPTSQKIYGVEIDENNSNPETSVTYTDDAVGFIPAKGNNGAFNWGSWESIIKDEFMIKPCVLNNPAKTVNYYLDYDNYNLKATGGASVLTGTDGDVMVEFGVPIYTKWTTLGSKHKIQFSVKPFEGATKNAFETENGYNQFAYYPLLLTQKLFQMIFKNRDSQTALGRGYVDANSSYATTGNTNTKGFMFGETTGKQQMKFLGIEDYWGNKYQWIDGLVTDASYNLLIGNSNFNDTGSGYTSHASGISANTDGYIDTVQGGNDKGFIIKGKSGSATTHYCDYGVLYSGRVARFGGDRSGGSVAGFARLQLSYGASDADAFVGGRLMCVNNGKLYIGAYLGTTQGGKLRSVSGTTPSDTKTISVFRTHAKNNN